MNKLIALIAVLFLINTSGCGCETVEPGNRGVLVRLGKVDENLTPEGLQFYNPLTTKLEQVNVRQQQQELKADCFSSDMQQVDLVVTVNYRIPDASVVRIFRDFHGDPFDTQVKAKIQESVKEATSTRSAEMIVKQREVVKALALEAARKKVGSIVVIEDLVISDVKLSKQLTASIESKMVQEQEAAKAKYTKQKAETDAETAVAIATGEANATLARAKAEAESIRIRGEALRQNPNVVELQLIEKWDGTVPTVVNGNSGLQMLLPALK